MKLSDLFEAYHPQHGDNEKSPWETSKWAAKKLDKDSDPVKATYGNLFADAFKTFPKQLQDWFYKRGYSVGGNTLFDMHIEWSDFGELFEEYFCEPYGDPFEGNPDQMHADLIEFGKVMTSIQDNIAKMKEGYDKFHELTKTTQSLAKVQRGYKAQMGLQLVIGSQRLEFFSFDGGHAGKVEHESMPIFMHINGTHERYPTKPSRIPYSFDADWFFDYVWSKLRSQYSLFDLLTDRVLSSKTKVKLIKQPTQPTEEDLRNWFDVK